MEQELFSTTYPSVNTERILYTPSPFAKTSLLHLQEAGSLQAIQPHTSSRENLLSYLCFVVLSGVGELDYGGKSYQLNPGNCVFINCRKSYAHSTSTSLWSLRWCHFYGSYLPSIYEKYKERGGQPVFHPRSVAPINTLLSDIYAIANSNDYIRDMRINEKLNTLLTLLMEESWHPENTLLSKKRLELSSIKQYLDEHCAEKINLDEIASVFFINKYYLSKIFKESYGMTINNYILYKRITKAKNLLRFTDISMDEIGSSLGMEDANYFSRVFKKVEGIPPREYRQSWRNRTYAEI